MSLHTESLILSPRSHLANAPRGGEQLLISAHLEMVLPSLEFYLRKRKMEQRISEMWDKVKYSKFPYVLYGYIGY